MNQSNHSEVRSVLVTGVRGKTGRAVAARLAAGGRVAVRGGSSDPRRVDGAGVDPVAFDWERPATWTAALAGVDAVYLVRPDMEEAPALVAGLLAQAPRAARVVLLSEMGVDHLPRESWAAAVERAVTTGGRPWTVLRPTWFQQVLTDERFFRDEIVERGELPMPTGAGAAVSWVDVGDIADVAVQALTTPGHHGRAYTISGPAAVEADEVARILTARIGREIRATDPSPGDVVTGLDPWVAAIVHDLHERVRAGGFGEVTDAVHRVTDRAPRAIERFVDAEFPSSLEPALP